LIVVPAGTPAACAEAATSASDAIAVLPINEWRSEELSIDT
jgi:hypothetical protein